MSTMATIKIMVKRNTMMDDRVDALGRLRVFAAYARAQGGIYRRCVHKRPCVPSLSGAKRLHPVAYINALSSTLHRLTRRWVLRTVLNSARKGRLSIYQATAYLAHSFKHLRGRCAAQCASWGTC